MAWVKFKRMPRKPRPENRMGVQVTPGNRGDVLQAIQSTEALEKINPSSPRPRLFLEHTRFSDNLTASDIALVELMLAIAHHKSLQDQKAYTVPVSDVLRFLGWHANPSYLEASLNRLRNGYIEVTAARKPYWRLKGRHRLILAESGIAKPGGGEPDMLIFALGGVARIIPRIPQRYEHVELAALSRMKSRWSMALYRWLLLKAWNPKVDCRPGRYGHRTGFEIDVKPRALPGGVIRHPALLSYRRYRADRQRHRDAGCRLGCAFAVQRGLWLQSSPGRDLECWELHDAPARREPVPGPGED